MSVTESITTFITRVDTYLRKPPPPPPSYWGPLGRDLVESKKSVIVFERPRVLLETESVEEATTFLLKEAATRKGHCALVYKFDTDHWQAVPIVEPEPTPITEPASGALLPS